MENSELKNKIQFILVDLHLLLNAIYETCLVILLFQKWIYTLYLSKLNNMLITMLFQVVLFFFFFLICLYSGD